MDMIQNQLNNQYYQCQKCELYINLNLQQIHTTFCQGISSSQSNQSSQSQLQQQPNINDYSDQQVYELSKLMQDYKLFDYSTYPYQQDNNNNNNQFINPSHHNFNYDNYISTDDQNYIDYYPMALQYQTTQSSQQQQQSIQSLQYLQQQQRQQMTSISTLQQNQSQIQSQPNSTKSINNNNNNSFKSIQNNSSKSIPNQFNNNSINNNSNINMNQSNISSKNQNISQVNSLYNNSINNNNKNITNNNINNGSINNNSNNKSNSSSINKIDNSSNYSNSNNINKSNQSQQQSLQQSSKSLNNNRQNNQIQNSNVQKSQIKQTNNNNSNVLNDDETFQCHECFDYIKFSDYSNHQTECKNRSIKCKYCHGYFPYGLINQHLRFCESNNNNNNNNSIVRTNSCCSSSDKPKNSSSRRLQNQNSSPNVIRQNNNNHRLNESDYEGDDINEDEQKYNDIDEHNSIENNNSIYECSSQNGRQYLDERQGGGIGGNRGLVNRIPQSSHFHFQSQSSTLSNQTNHTFNPNHRNNTNSQSNENDNNENNNNNNNNIIENSNDWSNLSPDRFNQALNVIFPSYVGEENDFRRQQQELFRNNLITRLINISRYGLSGENNRGLTSAQKNKFIKVKYKSEQQKEYKTCSICMCDYEEDEEMNILDCMHRYHVECISKWFQTRTTCPICKKDMAEYMTV